jgi:hypothetical protein
LLLPRSNNELVFHNTISAYYYSYHVHWWYFWTVVGPSIREKKADDIHVFSALSQAAGRIERIMIIPGNLAVILFGVILALMTGAPVLGFFKGIKKLAIGIQQLIDLGAIACSVCVHSTRQEVRACIAKGTSGRANDSRITYNTG